MKKENYFDKIEDKEGLLELVACYEILTEQLVEENVKYILDHPTDKEFAQMHDALCKTYDNLFWGLAIKFNEGFNCIDVDTILSMFIDTARYGFIGTDVELFDKIDANRPNIIRQAQNDEFLAYVKDLDLPILDKMRIYIDLASRSSLSGIKLSIDMDKKYSDILTDLFKKVVVNKLKTVNIKKYNYTEAAGKMMENILIDKFINKKLYFDICKSFDMRKYQERLGDRELTVVIMSKIADYANIDLEPNYNERKHICERLNITKGEYYEIVDTIKGIMFPDSLNR